MLDSFKSKEETLANYFNQLESLIVSLRLESDSARIAFPEGDRRRITWTDITRHLGKALLDLETAREDLRAVYRLYR